MCFVIACIINGNAMGMITVTVSCSCKFAVIIRVCNRFLAVISIAAC